jgi:hypothetical protein
MIKIFLYNLKNQYIKRLISLNLLIMIPKVKELKLIAIYLYICNMYDKRLNIPVNVSVIMLSLNSLIRKL